MLVLQFYSPCIIQRLMLIVLTLLIRRKNSVNADFTFTEAKRNRQNAKKVLYSAFNWNIISVKTAQKHYFCVVLYYVNAE